MISPHGRYELNKLTSLPMCGFIAQLVEEHTGNAEVTGSNPVEALIFFQASSFQLLKLENLLRWSFFTFILDDSYMCLAFCVYLSVRTCELFLCFALFVFPGFIVLTSCFLCFPSLVSFLGSYTEDERVLLDEWCWTVTLSVWFASNVLLTR